MSEAIAVALITGGLSLAGVIVSNLAVSRKNSSAMRTAQAVTDAKLEELTREVRELKELARRLPVVEEQIRGIKHRVSELEASRRSLS